MSGHKPLTAYLVDALIDAGTWVSRDELAAVRECSEVALDDALSDLVVAGRATWHRSMGYRLAATAPCRLAAQKRARDRTRIAVVGVPLKDGYHLGVAEERVDIGLVMYELALPLPGPDEDPVQAQLRMADAVIDFMNERGGSSCASK
jgi:hypothetical protein